MGQHRLYKDKEHKGYQGNSNSSWAWRCICKVKTELKTALQSDQWMVEPLYNIAKVYAKLNEPEQKQQTSKFVGGRFSFPKHRFIFWLVMKERLQTEKLFKLKISYIENCTIYSGCKSLDIFFQL